MTVSVFPNADGGTTYKFTSMDDRGYVISNWQTGDRIDISEIDADVTTPGHQQFILRSEWHGRAALYEEYNSAATGHLNYAIYTGWVIANDGSGDPYFTIQIENEPQLNGDSFIPVLDSREFGGDFGDYILAGGGDDYVVGYSGDDTLIGGGGDDTLDAGDSGQRYIGDDLLIGGDGNDLLLAEWGQDTLQGGNGDDTLRGDADIPGGSADILYGGAGNDTYVYLKYSDSTVSRPDSIMDWSEGDSIDLTPMGDFRFIGLITPSTPLDTFTFGHYHEGGDTWVKGQDSGGTFNIRLAGEHNLTASDFVDVTQAPGPVIVGTTGNDTLSGTAVDNVIFGDGGNDAAYGGGGNDSIDGGSGDDTLEGGGGDDLLDGTNGNDSLYGGVGNDALKGGAGNDTARGGSGYDTLEGGDGDDLLVAGNASSLLSGDAGYDLLIDGAGTDTLDGGADQDTVMPVQDGVDDIFYGGADADLLSYMNTNAGVVANLSTGTAVVSGFGFDRVQDFERLQGGRGDDHLAGDANHNIFFASGGVDTVAGGAGSDVYHMGNVSGRVVIDLAAGTAVGLGTGTAFLSSIEDAVGGTGADYLRGNDDANILEGRGGDDTLQGGLGDDGLIGGDGFDVASYADAAGPVTASLAIIGPQNTGAAGMDSFSGIEGLIGGQSSDRLTGNALNNLLAGGLGNDTLDGGAGSSDTASYTGSAPVSVSLAAVGAQDTNGAGVDTLIRIENLTGGSGNDTLTGDAGANILSGGFGNDFLTGGNGNDTLDGGAGTDTAFYHTDGAGVRVSLSISGSQNTQGAGTDSLSGIENVYGSNSTDILIGNESHNILSGRNGNDYLIGFHGNDYVSGDAGADTLAGGLGKDLLIGGSGADVFDFNSTHETSVGAAGRDRIIDFSELQGDRIDVRNIDADVFLAGDQAFTFAGGGTSASRGEIKYYLAGGNTYVIGGVDGDSNADFEIELTGLHGLDAGDFLL